jgi:hypothetical protein
MGAKGIIHYVDVPYIKIPKWKDFTQHEHNSGAKSNLIDFLAFAYIFSKW